MGGPCPHRDFAVLFVPLSRRDVGLRLFFLSPALFLSFYVSFSFVPHSLEDDGEKRLGCLILTERLHMAF